MKYSIYILVFFLSSCILLPYRPPKQSKYKLHQENKVGIKSATPLKTNGFYYFNYIDTVINKGEWYSGYYRFTGDGKLRVVHSFKGKISPDSLYLRKKESIQQDIDKHFYGYYSASGQEIELEYIWEMRENLTARFYESTGVLSENGDTLFVKEQLVRKYNKIEPLNRQCIFYEFPAD